MTHLARRYPDAVWITAYVPTGADFDFIDQNTYVALNGDQGGHWYPTTSIDIGGAGCIVAGLWSMASPNFNVAGQILFDVGIAEDVFQYGFAHPNRQVVWFVVLSEHYSDSPEQQRAQVPSLYSGAPTVTICGIVTLILGARYLCPLRVHHSGRIEQVEFLFNVGQSHANVPTTLPRFRVVAMGANGTVTPLRVDATTTDQDGFQFVTTPATGSAWYAAGASQTFVYSCNVAHDVDVENFAYFVEIIDESGSNALIGNTFTGARATIDGIELLDGRA